jgi:hypothetical protein
VPLQSHQIEPTQKFRGIGRHAHAGDSQIFTVTEHPSPYPFRRPRDVAVLEERDRIVGDRPPHRILKIQDAGIALAREQQISRVIVAMHERVRLRQSGLHQRLESSIQQTAPFRPGGDPQMPAQEPLGEQLHFTQQ